MSGASLFEKIWNRHLVAAASEHAPALLYIDFHLIHELTSPQAFEVLRQRGLPVRCPERTLATMDHGVSTGKHRLEPRQMSPAIAAQIEALQRNCAAFDIELLALGESGQGIVHVIGPESGASLPGQTIVCGDSHSSTHGALGALAFGIGTTEVGHVLASQCLLLRKPGNLSIQIEGALGRGVAAKDLILYLIGAVGIDAGTGQVVEYRGSTIASLPMEQRLTVCNMSIELGARAGIIAPDETTFAYLEGRPRAPQGCDFERALAHWQTLYSDSNARFDRQHHFDAAQIPPMITYGTHPGMAIGIDQPVPDPQGDPGREKALAYMGLAPGDALLGKAVDVVFIGSCTNGRISDLRAAASIFAGRKLAPSIRALIVPGSEAVRQAAEAEGLDRIFRVAGAEWRHSGCSMCVAINDDRARAGQYVVSTSNRNFEGRQGQGARTLLVSPMTAAATAVTGAIRDPRDLLQ